MPFSATPILGRAAMILSSTFRHPSIGSRFVLRTLSISPYRLACYTSHASKEFDEKSYERGTLDFTKVNSTQLPTSVVGSVLIPRPAHVKQSRVIECLPKLLFPFHDELRSLTFFITPEFVPWFDEDGSFMQDVLDFLYHHWQPKPGNSDPSEPCQDVIRSRVAVVDRIPFPSAQGSGSAGISLAIGPYGRLWRSKISSSPRVVKPTGRMPIITVRLAPLGDKISRAKSRFVLRPANTLFVNGLRSTMFSDQWALDAAAASGRRFVRQAAREHIDRFTFSHVSQSQSLALPMQKLTESREVSTCMGNVLSKLVGPRGSEPISASLELEKAIATHTKNGDGLDGTLSVLALVTPKSEDGADSVSAPAVKAEILGYKPPEDSEENSSDDLDDLEAVKLAISQGAHLHRVTGGGGGWGQKQGLLTLDPAFGFGKSDPIDTPSTNSPFTSQGSNEEGAPFHTEQSGPVVARPGDHVQFYGAIVSEGTEQAVARRESLLAAVKRFNSPIWHSSWWARGDESNLVFGVMPKEGEGASPLSVMTEDLIAIPHHFGMLSQDGMVLQRTEHEIDEQEPRSSRIKAEDFTDVTRIDVPYSMLKYSMSNRREHISQGCRNDQTSDKGDRPRVAQKGKQNRKLFSKVKVAPKVWWNKSKAPVRIGFPKVKVAPKVWWNKSNASFRICFSQI